MRLRDALREGSRRYHLIGIGGIGVSAVARLLMGLGQEVSGSDVRESSLTLALEAEGAKVTIGHDDAHVAGVDVVVVSTAIPDTNPELVAAKELGIPIVHRSEILGAVASLFPISIGVTGTHGKGTVSSAIAWILHEAGLEPSFAIGGMPSNLGTNARIAGRRIFVGEVDESDGTMVNTRPTHLVLNNLEADHLNYYEDYDGVVRELKAYAESLPAETRFFACRDDEGAMAALDGVQGRVTTYGDATDATFRGLGYEAREMGSAMDVTHEGRRYLDALELAVPGRYNACNMLGAMAVAASLDVAPWTVREALGQYRGLENRFTLEEAGSLRVVKDYTSHPTGIKRVLEAARAMASGGKVIAVFKPYRFTMIHYLADEYTTAFEDADVSVVTELYTAGEVPIPGVDADWVCQKIRAAGSEVVFEPKFDRITARLDEIASPGAIVVFFGGDDLFRLADGYIEAQRRTRS